MRSFLLLLVLLTPVAAQPVQLGAGYGRYSAAHLVSPEDRPRAYFEAEASFPLQTWDTFLLGGAVYVGYAPEREGARLCCDVAFVRGHRMAAYGVRLTGQVPGSPLLATIGLGRQVHRREVISGGVHFTPPAVEEATHTRTAVELGLGLRLAVWRRLGLAGHFRLMMDFEDGGPYGPGPYETAFTLGPTLRL